MVDSRNWHFSEASDPIKKYSLRVLSAAITCKRWELWKKKNEQINRTLIYASWMSYERSPCLAMTARGFCSNQRHRSQFLNIRESCSTKLRTKLLHRSFAFGDILIFSVVLITVINSARHSQRRFDFNVDAYRALVLLACWICIKLRAKISVSIARMNSKRIFVELKK